MNWQIKTCSRHHVRVTREFLIKVLHFYFYEKNFKILIFDKILDKNYNCSPLTCSFTYSIQQFLYFPVRARAKRFLFMTSMMCMEIVVKIFTQLTFLIVDMCSRLLSCHVNSSEAPREENEHTVKCYTNDSRKRSQNDNNKRLKSSIPLQARFAFSLSSTAFKADKHN